jgi:16S rRNA (uracil1498-N3)-methyltransferase
MRQFIVEKGKEKNGLIQLEGKDYRYLRQVLRVRAGDMISVRLPSGDLKNATVASVDEGARRVLLQICADTGRTITRGVQAGEVEGSAIAGSGNGVAALEYWLFQFVPRPQKFELIVRQATECGVSVIVPVIGEYSEKSSLLSLQGAKKERLERIIREARQQSGSPVDTRVLEPVNLEKAIELWQEACGAGGVESSDSEAVAFVLSERADCSGNLRATVQKAGGLAKIKKAAIAVGSEGGISPEEVRLLEEKGLFVPVHFAVNILRCETAALYGIAAVQSEINN